VIVQLRTSVARIPSDTGSGSDPALFVVPAGAGSSTVDLYRRFSGAPAGCRAREKVVAIASTGVLNTPDQVSASGRRRGRDIFEMSLEIRRFEGSIRANDPWIALIRMELGSLEAGAYQLVVQETARRYTELRHPERATNPTTSERRISFNCV
jgi:hypothetical protein